MIPPLAILDSCVLYSAALRDLFMRLANAGLYGARWTERIHEEWIENVLANRPDLTREMLERTRALMDLHAEGSLVENYEHIIPTLTLPDEDDRHVLAAAVAAEASVIVTFNLSDFPEAALAPHGVDAEHPDAFLCGLFDATPERFVEVAATLLAALRRPPRTLEQHIPVLRRQGLPRLAQRLSKRREPECRGGRST